MRSFYVAGDIKTTLLSGSNFNVTWHLAYPHRVSRKIYYNLTWLITYSKEKKIIIATIFPI